MKKFWLGYLLIAIILVDCSFLKGKEDIPQQNDLVNVVPDQESTEKERSPHSGVIKIRRKGVNYDIQMEFDTGDENVYFQMDLPDDGSDATVSRGDAEITLDDRPDVPQQSEVMPSQQPQSQPQQVAQQPPMPEPVKQEESGEQTAEQKQQQKENTSDDVKSVTRHILQAQTYVYEQRYERALYEIDEALKIVPDSAVALALRGTVYFKLSDEKAAIESWEAALEIDPTLENVRENLKKLKKSK